MLLFLNKAALDYYTQKAKCSHLKLGDRGTKYFHSLVKRNANKRHIAAITLEDGSISTSSKQVAKEFVDHFQSLLGTAIHVDPIDSEILNLGPKLDAT